MIDPPCLACVLFCVAICTKFVEIYLARRISHIRCRHLERATIIMIMTMIDHRKKHKNTQLQYLSRMCTTSAVHGSRGVEPGSLLRRTRLLLHVEKSQRCLMRISQRQCLPNSHIRLCLQFGELGGFLWRE